MEVKQGFCLLCTLVPFIKDPLCSISILVFFFIFADICNKKIEVLLFRCLLTAPMADCLKCFVSCTNGPHVMLFSLVMKRFYLGKIKCPPVAVPVRVYGKV
uniref:Secreted protein n=1 Tax=Pyxicephalus adspersus TaxID=30357 RepID=A0AAV3A4T4_PYXAD|nr:TPA: hypothetical protein GDO54_011937 [Pyxicephalus adspersus]